MIAAMEAVRGDERSRIRSEGPVEQRQAIRDRLEAKMRAREFFFFFWSARELFLTNEFSPARDCIPHLSHSWTCVPCVTRDDLMHRCRCGGCGGVRACGGRARCGDR